MRISWNWLSDYLDPAVLREKKQTILEQLTLRGLEVESVEELSRGFEHVVSVLIESREKHPNADRLSVCQVFDGANRFQIVCGAQNMKAGDKVPLAKVGAILPNKMEIKLGKIRNVESQGMLCSETELGLAETSDGLLILPSSTAVGMPVAKVLGREDTIVTLNVTPNRGDALSLLGVAREVAAICGTTVRWPDAKPSEASEDGSKRITAVIEPSAQETCTQYHARWISGVKVGPSPEWLQQKLLAVGLRPINNVVDVTNFVMMESGQPLHAFDASQVVDGGIKVRMASAQDLQTPFSLLDGTEIQLRPEDLIIADCKKPLALAGVMGGASSAVSVATSQIILESAQFEPGTIHRACRFHQKQSDSSYRFERRVNPLGVRWAIDRAAALIVKLAGGEVGRGIASAGKTDFVQSAIPLNIERLNSFLGVDLTIEEVKTCLKSIGFESTVTSSEFSVSVPLYRSDIVCTEDLYEEVLRVWGYDRVPVKVPALRELPQGTGRLEQRALALDRIRRVLAANGFSESINYAFASPSQVLGTTGFSAEGVWLENPLNQELSVMKTSLLGGLLENVLRALRHQEQDVRLFEIRPTFHRDATSTTGVKEVWQLALIATGRSFSEALAAREAGLNFFDLRGFLEAVADAVGTRGLRWGTKTVVEGSTGSSDARFHPAQHARVFIGKADCGILGRIHPQVESSIKVRQPIFALEVELQPLIANAGNVKKIVLPSRFPAAERELTVIVPLSVTSEQILTALQKCGRPLLDRPRIVDLYQGASVPAGHQSVSLAFAFQSPDRTLEEAEVDAVFKTVIDGLKTGVGAVLRDQV